VSNVDYLAKKTPIKDWSQLQQELEKYFDKPTASWAFRGAGKTEWALQSSLERLGIKLAVEAERYVLTTFQRRVHHYISAPPAQDDYLEWLALLQHHGAPTRLLDWTKSPYVALFFALDERREAGGFCALWAIDLRWCKNQAIQVIQGNPLGQTLAIEPDESLGKPGTFPAAFFTEPPLKFVTPLQPFRMNERLTIQQGLFLCPGDLRAGFESNLLAFQMPDFADHVQKLVIPIDLREKILAMLNKMNINRASLFPGIDGFAQSLISNVQIATSEELTLSSELSRLNIYSEYGFL
jgi:hypothetical protein